MRAPIFTSSTNRIRIASGQLNSNYRVSKKLFPAAHPITLRALEYSHERYDNQQVH